MVAKKGRPDTEGLNLYLFCALPHLRTVLAAIQTNRVFPISYSMEPRNEKLVSFYTAFVPLGLSTTENSNIRGMTLRETVRSEYSNCRRNLIPTLHDPPLPTTSTSLCREYKTVLTQISPYICTPQRLKRSMGIYTNRRLKTPSVHRRHHQAILMTITSLPTPSPPSQPSYPLHASRSETCTHPRKCNPRLHFSAPAPDRHDRKCTSDPRTRFAPCTAPCGPRASASAVPEQ